MKNEVLHGFIDKVRWVHEVDYGDFKRKVGLYLFRLESQFSADEKARVADLLLQMRMDIVFNPKGDVNSARIRTLELAEQIGVRLKSNH